MHVVSTQQFKRCRGASYRIARQRLSYKLTLLSDVLYLGKELFQLTVVCKQYLNIGRDRIASAALHLSRA